MLSGDINVRAATNQTTLLSNNSHPNPLLLYVEFDLANRFKRNYEDITKNLFDIELIKLYGS